MPTFILVHGSFLASWCWREVLPRLRQKGHDAWALDLPAHGSDTTPPNDVTMQDYVDAVLGLIRTLDRAAILVGHSMGGPIAGAAESQSDAVAGLVFVAGCLPPSGSTLLEMVGGFDPEYVAQLVWAADRRTASLSDRGVREFWTNRCPPELVDEILPRLTPEPVGPYEAPIIMTPESFGRVPRYYVETRHDRVVPPALQRSIQARVGFERVFSIDGDHLPFFSAPEELVSCLDAVASLLHLEDAGRSRQL